MKESVLAMFESTHTKELKPITSLRRYAKSILVLSLNTLLLYFYYNSFAPILSLMAKDFGFTDEERDYRIGMWLFLLNQV